MKYILLVITISFFFFQCKKDIEVICESPVQKTLIDWDSCFILPRDPYQGTVLSRVYTEYNYYPYYGDTPNEIGFFRVSIGNAENICANICNESYDVNHMYFLPNQGHSLGRTISEWNSEGWGLITYNANIWKVNKDIGIAELVKDDQNLYSQPIFCSDGNMIFTDMSNQELIPPLYGSYVVLMSLEGEILDTLLFGGRNFAHKNGKIAGTYFDATFKILGYYDLNTKILTEVLDLQNSDFQLGSIAWLDDNHIIGIRSKDFIHEIIKININTSEITSIYFEDCENIRYGLISSSPAKDGKILTTRLEYRFTAPDPDSLYFFQYPVMMDTNTGEQWVLEFDI